MLFLVSGDSGEDIAARLGLHGEMSQSYWLKEDSRNSLIRVN